METLASTVRELMSALEEDGVQLHIEHDQLKYRAPPGILTPERLNAIRARKDAILEAVRSRARSHPIAAPDDAEAAWRPLDTQVDLATAHPAPRIYDIRRWHEPMESQALQAAFDALVQRHGILRTRYVAEADGELWAVTEKTRSIPIDWIDLSDLETDPREARGHEICHSLTARPFDHETGPLLRLGMIRMARDELVSVLVACHSIFDALSMPVFFSEFVIEYRAALSGKPSPLDRLPLQFRSYAQMRNALADSPTGYEHLLHWRERLLQLRRPVPPRTDWPTSPGSSRDMGIVNGFTSEQTLNDLRTQMAQLQCTMRHCVTAAFCLALAQWGPGSDVFLWIQRSGRTIPELEKLIGCFVESVPLLVDLSGEPAFSETCARIRHEYESGLEHCGCTARQLRPLLRRTHACRPFLEPLLDYVDTEAPDTHCPPELRVPLAIRFHESHDRLSWTIRYRSPEYQDATLESLSAQLAGVLSGGVTAPFLY